MLDTERPAQRARLRLRLNAATPSRRIIARATGEARADAYRLGIAAVGAEGFTAIQIAGVLAEHGVRLVPDIAVSGDGGSGGLATAMLGRVLAGTSRVENGK